MNNYIQIGGEATYIFDIQVIPNVEKLLLDGKSAACILIYYMAVIVRAI